MIFFDQCDVIVNGTGILATQATLSTANSLAPIKIIGHRGILTQAPQRDLTSNLQLSYFLETDKDCVASVSFEYGRAYVNCDKKGTYHFDLERLFEGRFDNNGYDWGWYKQLQEKNWVTSEVLLLILVLFNMFAELKVEEQYA